MELTKNTILITGGTSGIGLEMVKEFLKRDNTLIITGRNKSKLEKIKKEFQQIHIYQSDVSNPKDIDSLYQKITAEHPQLNVLINNAGIMKTIDLQKESYNPEELTREIEINLMGPVRMTKRFLAHLKTKPEAAIINISSGLAFVPLPSAPVYCATKAALHSFTLSLRIQLSNTHIHVFEVAPPATQTELLGDFDSEDMKGITVMKVEEMVQKVLKGIERNQFEIRPGQSNQLKFMSRLAPNFILNQMSKPVERMHKEN